MKHTKRVISGFIALAMCAGAVQPADYLHIADVAVVDAASVYTTNKTGTEDGYDFELWNQDNKGRTTMTLLGNGAFSCEWSGIFNCLFRTGKKLGSTKKYQDYGGITLNYDVDYNIGNTNSYMCVYGWTEDPTVEYYIVEGWGSWRPPGGNGKVGTTTIDGNTYDIYKTTRYNEPSIHGTETFEQYWSVRQTKANAGGSHIEGTISVSKHFEAWEKAGLKMGKMYEVALNIEGYDGNSQGAGKATVNKNELVFGAGGGNSNNNNNNNNNGNTNTQTPAQSTITGTAPSGTGTGVSDDFEGSGTTWSPRGESVKLLLSGDMKHGGSKALAVTGRTASWNGASASSSELKAGGSYSFSSYVGYKNDSYTSSGFEFGLQYDLNGKTNYDNIGSATASSGKWAELSGDFKVPSGAENISIYVQSAYSENDTAKDLIDFFIDDVKLTSSGGNSNTGNNNNNNGNTGNNNTGNTGTQTPASSDSLRGKFANCFKVGTSVSPRELSTGADFIKKHFNSITPENELKPDSLLRQGSTDNERCIVSLQNAAQTLKFCENNNIAVRGHTFVWHSQTPDWFFKEGFSSSGAWVSKETMNKRLENFIKDTFEAIAKEYPNLNLYAYDVCNELFKNDGGGMRPPGAPYDNSYWTQVYGADNDEFVLNAFKYARKYAPAGCKLYINDYNEYIDAKTQNIYDIAMKVKAEGNIDGIGMQSHLATNYPTAAQYEKALKKFISTGLDVQITELDIQTKDGGDSARAKLFQDIFQLAVDNADHISSVTVWGTHDDISWRGSDKPLMFGSGYTPKEDYKKVMAIDVSGVSGSNNNTGNNNTGNNNTGNNNTGNNNTGNNNTGNNNTGNNNTGNNTGSTSSGNYLADAKKNFTNTVPADMKQTDKGTTSKITYFSKKAQRNKKANVWLPPGYSKDKKYPVLYMNHGVMGGEDDMVSGWGIREMATALIEKGEVQPFIIVFPQMYTGPNAEKASGITQQEMDYYDDYLYDLTESLMPYMAENYSVAEGRDNTAIAGFSMGGRESLYIGMMACDKIGYVCASSPAPGIVPAQDMFLNHRGSMTEAEFGFKTEPYILMIGGGTNDSVVGTFPKQYHELYEKKGVDHIWFEVAGAGHDASVGTPLFYNFFRNLFKASSAPTVTEPPVTTPVTTTTTTTTQPPVTTTKPTTTTTQNNQSTTNKVAGDVDGNGAVTAADVVKLMQALVGKTTLTDAQKKNADMNGDGKISIIDLIKLKNILI